jgi:dTDP-4-dehydrorhamnose reductase
MKKKKILILGSNGFYGKQLKIFLNKKKIKVFSDTKIKNYLKGRNGKFFLNRILVSVKPNVIINLVANTDVNFCERNKVEAKKSNVDFTKNLIYLILKNKIKSHLIHFSTDQVYSGKGNHSEKRTAPKNYYGITKLRGETYAKKIPCSILRLNFVGKSNNTKNLSNWIISNLKKNKKINVFKNIFFNPIHISTLNNLIIRVLNKPANGTFNLGSKTKISKANFALNLCQILKFDTKKLRKINYEKKKIGVERPLDMSLNVSKFEKTFKCKLPTIKEEIVKLAKEFR